MERSHYQRSKLAKLLGLNKETLRYYEAKGIVSPRRESDNGYRVYDEWDCQKLIYLRMLRAYGFSLEDATGDRIGFGSDAMIQLLEARRHDMERELRRLEREQQILEELQRLAADWQREPGSIRVEHRRERLFFLEQLQGWAPLLNEDRNQAAKLLTDALPISFYGMTLRTDFLNDPESASALPDSDSSGIFWRESDLSLLPEELQHIRPDRIYSLDTVWRIVYRFHKYSASDAPDEQDVLVPLKGRLRSAGVRASGSSILRILPVSLETEYAFLELILPIEQQGG